MTPGRSSFAWLLVLAAMLAMARPAESSAAPPFKVRDMTGRTLDLASLRQKGPVLLDFWATWCRPCLAAIPELQRWHSEYGPRGLTVIGISVDGPRNHARVRPFATRLGITYPIAIDEDERLRHLYQVVAMPTAVLIDPDGQIAMVRTGYHPGEGETLERAILEWIPSSSTTDSSAVPAPADTAASPAKP